MKKAGHTGIVILVASLLLAVTFMNIAFMFRMTTIQTRDAGTYQLTAISGELENTLSEAEKLTMSLGVEARELLDDKDALEAFLYEKRAELREGDSGAFAIYIAGTGWEIVPNFDLPEGFQMTDRIWYTGGIKSAGMPYVSAPYQDVVTGDICYTVSIMLPDHDTVLGVDYTMENIQAHIGQMYEMDPGTAVIVTDEGIIAGCTDESLVGERLLSALPEYAGVYSLARNRNGVAAGRVRSDVLYENLFATRSAGGWYLIVSVSDWELYRNAYMQLIFTLVLTLALFGIIICLYLLARRSQKRAETAYEAKEQFLENITKQLRGPLRWILDKSDPVHAENTEDYREDFSRIHSAGEQLSEMIGQIISYSDIVRTEEDDKRRKKSGSNKTMNRHFRAIIIIVMTFVMLVSIYTNLSATWRWGNVVMQREAEIYEFELSEWVDSQKSILDMFCSIISTHPEMLKDYEGTVDYLNRITAQYPEISVTYMASPDLTPTVIMNNGWKPESGWRVEERQWYIDTINSETGWSISAPYYDEQTGGYCVTISERVYDAATGEFLGNFGIDFFMDKLVDILGDSYSNTGYAFLVDTKGDIINHPYGSYQMTMEQTTNVSDSPYASVPIGGQSTKLVRDYDGSLRILLAVHNLESTFTVYVASSLWKIYRMVVIYGLICLLTFFLSIALLYRLLTDLIHWQDDTNKQMKEAADAAIAAGRAKSQFLAQMSHEIRTPINAVLGMNEMILRESKSASIRDYAGNIRAAGRTLLALINSILDFSKIEDGKMEILPVTYDTSTLINNLVVSISGRARAKGLEFIVHADETLPASLYGDDVRISQVIMNLLTNAVKYTEHGRVVFTIQGVNRTADTIELAVEVRDTGIGIREEDMTKLFESFERLDEIRNRNIEGTGLGMSIVTKLLDMMGSSLRAESVYGQGSAFSFRLQQKIVDATPMGRYEERVQLLADNDGEPETFHAPDAKILVVDDNEMNLKVASNLLKLCGIKATLASSGEEAIACIRRERYHIVFLDHMMPKMDGIETLKKLREENLLGPDMKMVALTANAVVGAREEYLEAGFDDYLSKPIEMAELEEQLRRYLPQESVCAEKEDDEILEFAPASERKTDHTEESEKQATGAPDNKEILRRLEVAGIDVQTGITYCAGEDFYLEMVRDYMELCPEKTGDLERTFAAEDWKNYKIYIHALKTASRTIGATALGEEAAALEAAAKEDDAAYIKEHHADVMDHYGKLAEELEKALA